MDFKSGKISKPILPNNFVMLMLFPIFDKLSTTKNTNATFSSPRKYLIHSMSFFNERKITEFFIIELYYYWISVVSSKHDLL